MPLSLSDKRFLPFSSDCVRIDSEDGPRAKRLRPSLKISNFEDAAPTFDRGGFPFLFIC